MGALPDAIDLGFWRVVLGYAPLHEDNCVDPLGAAGPDGAPTSESDGDQEA